MPETLPVQITFRNLAPSKAIEAKIEEKAAKLFHFFKRLMRCKVVVESPHHHHHQGTVYHVRINLAVPGAELVVNKTQELRHAHEDVYVAIRDAFLAAERQLKEFSHKVHHQVKNHTEQPVGKITKLFPDQDYGLLETPDGKEVYFHRHSVLNSGFDHLKIGSLVHFAEEDGEKGPQASTVHPI